MTLRPEDLNGSANGVLDRPGGEAAPWPVIKASALPTFPLDALPREVRRWVLAIAEETQTPFDLPAIISLGVLSAAGNGGAKVDCGAWEEELGLYLLPVMETGENKSAVLGKAKAPLAQIEREWRANASETLRELRIEVESLKARQAKLTRTAGEASDPADRLSAKEELREVAATLEEIGEPATPRLFADDVTPEQLGSLLATHGQLAVLAAEAPLIDNLVGRYSEGNPNLHVIVKAYTGEEHRTDRRNRTEVLERPLLAITLVVQPHVLTGLVDHQVADSQGLVARFAYALPETRQGHRELDPPRVPADVEAAWAATVQRVATLNPLTQLTQSNSVSSVSNSLRVCLTLSLSPTAKRVFYEMRADHEARLAEGGDLAPYRGWVNRQRGRVARIAGILHLAQSPDPDEPIAEETMRNAVKIGDYFMAHSLAALTVPNRLERRALRWLGERLADGDATVTQRDLQRGPLNSRAKAKEAEKLVQALEARHALRPVGDHDERRVGRPPSPTFEINPTLRPSSSAEPSPNGNGWGAIEGEEMPDVYRPTDEDLRDLMEGMQ
jgi:replicative DNA helicase